MQEFFKVAIMFTIAMTFVNGFLFVFSDGLLDQEQSGTLTDLKITKYGLQDLNTIQEPVAKAQDPFSASINWIGGGYETVSGAVGGLGQMFDLLFKVGVAWEGGLASVFSGIPTLYCDSVCIDEGNRLGLLQLTVIPLVYLMQILSITYIILYGVSALRGGTV